MSCKCVNNDIYVNRYGQITVSPKSCDKIIICEDCIKEAVKDAKAIQKAKGCPKFCSGVRHEADKDKHEAARAKGKPQASKEKQTPLSKRIN